MSPRGINSWNVKEKYYYVRQIMPKKLRQTSQLYHCKKIFFHNDPFKWSCLRKDYEYAYFIDSN